MTHTASARRMGNLMAEVLIEDFKSSGYMSLFETGRKAFTIKSHGHILTIRSWEDLVTKYTHVEFIISDATSGRTETLAHRYTNRSLGWTKVMRDINASWELDMLWVTSKMASMLDLLYENYTINGERKELHAGGSGYSSIAKDSVVGEWDQFRHTGSLAGGGSQ